MIFDGPNPDRALEDLKLFLKVFSQNSQSVYWLAAPDMSIAYISPSFEKIWGRRREELYEHPEVWITYLHPEDQSRSHPILNLIEQMKKDPLTASFNENYRVVRPDGDVRWIMDKGFPIIDSKGTIIAVTGVAMDVTKEHQYEIMLKKEKERAEEANRLKTEFLTNARHDFRTAFMGILSLSDVMASMEEDPDKQENLRAITQSASSLLKQHDELLEMAKIEDGFMDITCTVFEVKDLMDDIYLALKPAALEGGLSLLLEIEDNVPQKMATDNMRLKRMLLNIASNAIKFTNQGYVKLIVKYIDDGTIVFAVEDTGIGISEENQEKIFESFGRITPAFKGKYKGSGLGLRAVKRFSGDINAKVFLQSRLGEGSVFSISLPWTHRCPNCEKGLEKDKK